MLEDSELNIPDDSAPPEPKRSGSRSFLVVAGTLGAIMLLALVGMAVYALVILPQQQAAEPEQPSSAQLTSTAVALALQATDTPTRTPTSTFTASPTQTATDTPTDTPTETPITPLFTNTFTATTNAATATVDALLTQAAIAQTQAATPGASATADGSVTATPTVTPSALPDSGFADNLGIPGLLLAAAIMLMIIFTARRLRSPV